MTKAQLAGDKLAILLSSLCVVHCIATPILIIVLPALGSLVSDNHEVFHQVLLYFVIPVGLFALYAGYRHHRRLPVFLIGLAGLVLLAVAAFVVHDMWGEVAETIVTVFASLLIIVAHLFNFRLRQHTADV